MSRDAARFTSTLGFTVPREREIDPVLSQGVMYRDPPDCVRHRKPLTRFFTMNAMAGCDRTVRAIVLQVLDEVSDLDEFDFVEKVAAEIPARTVARLVGMPDADHGKLVEWAYGLFSRDWGGDGYQRFEEASAAIAEYAAWFIEEKRTDPGDDVTSALLEVHLDGEPLSSTVIDMWFHSLVGAGFETTHTLIAQGLVLLDELPELRERLTQDEGAIPNTIEEMLRFICPVNMLARTAVVDVELDGQLISAGNYVTMWFPAANRDPAVFDDPHTFDIDRMPNRHQAFGAAGSAHYCLGANLAKLEMRVLLEELAARDFPFELAGEPVNTPGMFMNSLSHVPVRRRA